MIQNGSLPNRKLTGSDRFRATLAPQTPRLTSVNIAFCKNMNPTPIPGNKHRYRSVYEGRSVSNRFAIGQFSAKDITTKYLCQLLNNTDFLETFSYDLHSIMRLSQH